MTQHQNRKFVTSHKRRQTEHVFIRTTLLAFGSAISSRSGCHMFCRTLHIDHLESVQGISYARRSGKTEMLMIISIVWTLLNTSNATPVLLGWQLSDCGYCQYHLMTKSAIT